jgi:hypothetical protein
MIIDALLLLYGGFMITFRIECDWYYKLIGVFFLLWGISKVRVIGHNYYSKQGIYVANNWWRKIVAKFFVL